MSGNVEKSFFEKKRVLITGNTGFKGSWLSKILLDMGADVVGYSLEPPTEENLYTILGLEQNMKTIHGDVRDYECIDRIMQEHQPEIVMHLAAQPLVRESYVRVRETYETNVMGTVNVLDAVRGCDSVRSFLNVTTDKVYENKEWSWGYREVDNLNGYDPYSNSKSCSELVTASFRKSFFQKREIAISTARAGNVIGGGDFAKDRIVPDCVAAARNKESIKVRNPYSIRPYQHVLEALFAYLLIVEKQYMDLNLQGEYNVGPEDSACVSTGQLVTSFCKYWGDGITWEQQAEIGAVHEANFLKLDSSKIKNILKWNHTWGIEESIRQTVEWSKRWIEEPDGIRRFSEKQIQEFSNEYTKRSRK